MGKKGIGWFSSVKRAFKSSSKDSSDKKKENVGNWHHDTPEVVSVEHFPAESSATSSSPPVTEEQHALAVTMATAEAAEAAIAAAQAAAKVVRLSGYRRHTNKEKAAVLIQSYYRGYLARRALRALKGLVRLQALVRGHNVRRQAQMTMRCMQALVRVQARVKARRLQIAHERLQKEADRELLERFKLRSPLKDLDLECWNGRIHERLDQAMERPYKISDAHMRRERALAYAYNYQQQKLETLQSDPSMEDASLYNKSEKPPWGQNWLESWVTSQPHDNETRNPHETSNLTTFTSTDDASSERTVEMDKFTITPPKTQEFTNIYKLKPAETETETNRNLHMPSYMTPTQSAKAKVRTQGQPTTKQRSLSVSMSPWNNSTKRGGSSPLASGCDSSSSGAYQFGNSPSPMNQSVCVQQARKIAGFSSDSSVNSIY